MIVNKSNVKRALILSGGGARGAYQVGVWRRLQELAWQPDLVCGTSIGSLNGALIGMGWDASRMENFWEKLEKKDVFRFSFWQQLKNRLGGLFGRHPDSPALLDNGPLLDLLTKVIDDQRLRDSSPEVVVSTTDVRRARLRYFSGEKLSARHIFASCSIPVVFPWCEIDGELYWDGGIMANTPLLPALERGARDIVIVLLAPLTGAPVLQPSNTREAIAWAMDLATVASVKVLGADLFHRAGMDVQESSDIFARDHFIDAGGIRMHLVAPQVTSGLESLLDVDPRLSKERIEAGYSDACAQLTRLKGRESAERE